MPRAAGQKEYISLFKGLITEASSLSFPENATAEELNFNLDKDGFIRKRRDGFTELVTPFVVPGPTPKVENVFYWRAPSLVCVVVTDATPKTSLRFHAVDDDFTFILGIDISDQVVSTQIAETTDLLCITTSGGQNPILCEYTEATKEIVVNDITLYIRDFELVDDGLEISENPVTLSENHRYNLYNASWYLTRPDENNANIPTNVASAYENLVNAWPNNAEIPSVGIIIDTNGDTVFSPKTVEGANFGNSQAGRGHYVYSILDFDRQARIDIPSQDGAPSKTLTLVGTVNFSGTPSYNPDEPTNTIGPAGGGGLPPYQVFGER